MSSHTDFELLSLQNSGSGAATPGEGERDAADNTMQPPAAHVSDSSLNASAPGSVPSSLLNALLESQALSQQQQNSSTTNNNATASPEARFWDSQMSQGRVSMLPRKLSLHTNIMVVGQSGLGKTVSGECSCAFWHTSKGRVAGLAAKQS